MKYEGKRKGGASKEADIYTFTVGKDQLEILTKLTQQAYEYTPKVFEVMQYRAKLRDLTLHFGKVWIEEVKGRKMTKRGSVVHKRIKQNITK